MLNGPESPEGSGSQNTGDPGNGSGSGSSSIEQPKSDTTKLADYLGNYEGRRLNNCNLYVSQKSDSGYNNMSKILSHVRVENPQFFNKRFSSTKINTYLIESIRGLNKNYL
jgi:hypothetical protein